MALSSEILEKVTKWQAAPFDEATRAEIKALVDANEEKELTERFYKQLEFGTGGMRGIMGAGCNRMNSYTVAAASQGLATYIKKQGTEAISSGIAISYDSRNNSEKFAKIAASVFATNGIKTYIYPTLNPVPLLAYAVRRLGCFSGVMVTASHNPPQYNGYKVFGADGCQVVAPHDAAIIEEVYKIESGSVGYKEFDVLLAEGAINIISEDVNEGFDAEVMAQVTDKAAIKEYQADTKIVYSPIHGSGNVPVRNALKKAGFENILVVKEQEMPDGNFPTVEKPNPEEKPAMKMAVALAEKENADLVVATDPDADRVGIAVKNLDGEFVLVNGNQTGSILVDYKLSAMKELGTLPSNGAVVSTIVTTGLIKKIAEAYGVAYFETLTGFKHIGTQIRKFEEAKAANQDWYQFIVGGEESYGYMIGDFVRDKDAVTATVVLAEICVAAKKRNTTVYRYLLDIYRRIGCYKEDLVSIELTGKDGMEKMGRIMKHFRSGKAADVVTKMQAVTQLDYQEQLSTDLSSGSSSPLNGFPKSNVLQYILADGSKISLRPSGTEPKIKFYFSVCSKVANDASDRDIETVISSLDERIEEFKTLLCNEVDNVS